MNALFEYFIQYVLIQQFDQHECTNNILSRLYTLMLKCYSLISIHHKFKYLYIMTWPAIACVVCTSNLQIVVNQMFDIRDVIFLIYFVKEFSRCKAI